ncbi:glycoside hydrolase family 23 protein, partial [Microstroma glucosiphilum]
TDAEHPNGAPDFLACGISRKDQHSPWTPPHVTMQDIKIISSEQAANTAVFKPCAKYKAAFDRVAHQTGVPAVLLMSFALQESGCQASQIGPNGEFGLMQITPEKCGGAPGGDCRNVDFNIGRGAKYFKDQLDGPAKGNILAAAGTYNGWKPGSMSYQSATNKQYGCASQNNLDYLNSLFNGFCQGKDGYSNEFVKFGNLKQCGN